MKIAVCKLKSESAYSQSRNHDTPYKEKERPDEWDERTWRDRCNYDKDGHIFIPPQAFAICVKEAAKYLSIQIPGKGKQTFTKNFESSILVSEPLTLPITKDEVESERVFVPANGQRGSGKRVWRRFPVIPSWTGTVTFYLLDDTITEDVFEYVLRQAGNFIGIGRFRPRNWGFYGRFNVEGIKWQRQ